MNSKLQNDPYVDYARAYADAIIVPRFDLAAIERRSPRRTRDAAPNWRSYAAAAVIVLGLAAWAAPAVPALIADVQSAMQFFLERNGRDVPATDRLVTIDQAMRDLPFRVIPPNGVTLAVTPTVREILVPGDPMSTQLLVQYASNARTPNGAITAFPALTIIETAASVPQGNLRIAVHPIDRPPMRPPNGTPPGVVQMRAMTDTWIENGTRITLLGTPGLITQAQIDQIRRAMGG